MKRNALLKPSSRQGFILPAVFVASNTIAIVLILALFVFTTTPAQAANGIQKTINFQGKVVNADGTNVTDGTYDFVVKMYDGAGNSASNLYTESWTSAALFSSTMATAPTTTDDTLVYSSNTNEATLKVGQILWNTTKEESVVITSVNTGTNTLGISRTIQNWATGDTITNKVYVKDGVFRIAINSLNQDLSAVNFGTDTLFVGVNFNTDGEMKPRMQLSANAYAFNAEKVNGLTVTNTSNNPFTSTTTLKINDGSTVTFGANFTTGSNALTFTTSGTTSLALPTTGTLGTLAGIETLTNKTIGTGGLTFENSETINNSTNSMFTFGRNDAGTVTLTAADNDTTAALTILPGGAAAMILGGSSMTGLTVTTDGTGTAEVVLPAGSIDSTEILDATILPADLQITGSATDEYCITYESTGTQFEYQTCGISSQWTTAGSDISYSTGNVGIGDTSADNPLEILSTSTQLRLTHTDATDDTTFGVDTNGDLTIDLNATGGAGNLLFGDADTLAIGGVGAGLAYNAVSDSGGATSHALASDDDLFVEGELEINGTLWSDGALTSAGLITASAGITVANGQSTTLSSFVTDANGVLYTNTSGVVSKVVETETGSQCLLSGAGSSGVPVWGSCTGSTSLQVAYAGGNSIETAANLGVVITETTTGAFSGDLLQLTANQAASGSFSGDALQIIMDGVTADAFTGNGIRIEVDASQNTGNMILAEDDAGADLFVLSEAGVVTLAGAQTTDITSVVTSGLGAALAFKPGLSTGASSNGGAITISGGDGSGTTSVTGGALSLTAGSATGGSGTRNGGSVTLNAGDGATADGAISIGTANTTGITLGNVTNNTTLTLTGTGATNLGGALDVAGTLTSGTTNAFQVDATGNITITGTTGLTMSGAGSAITLQNSETLKNSTDGQFLLGRNDAGIVTLTAADNDTTAALTILPGGAAAMVLGGSSMTGLTVTTDGTGTAEVALPAGSIDSTEILDATILPVDLAGTGLADEFCLTYEVTGTTFEWQSCSGSTSLQTAYTAGNSIETSGNTAMVITETTTGANSGDLLQLTANPAAGGTFSGDGLQITMDAVDASGFTGNGLRIEVDASQNTGNLILAEDDAGADLFVLSETGVVTLAGSQTSDITSVVSSGLGAALTFKPGLSTGASSNGGAVTISAGDGSGTTSVTGGALTLTAGSATGGSGTRNGGSISLNAGDGATVDGAISIGTANTTGITFGNGTNNSTFSFAGSGAFTAGGNVDIAGTLTAGTSDAFQVNSTGMITTSNTTGLSLTGAGSAISFQNNETVKNSTDGQFLFGRNDAGIVTLTAADNDTTAALTILPGGAAAMIIGGSSMTGLTVTTDSTGTAEVVLPAGSIDSTEILDATILPVDLAGTGIADEFCLTYEVTGTTFEWQSCSGSTTLQTAYTGGNSIETSGNTAMVVTETTTGANTGDLLQLTANPATGGTFAGDGLQITMDAVDANGFTGNGLRIEVDVSQNTGFPLLIEDDASSDLFSVTEAGLAMMAGGFDSNAASTVTGLTIDGAVTTALDISNTGVTNDIQLQNDETIDNNVNGTITFGRNDTGTVILTAKDNDATAALTILPGGAAAMILGGSSMTGLTITTDGTGDAELTLPGQSVAASEVLNNTLDFAQLADALTLDASTSISFGAAALGLTFTNNGSGNEIHNLSSTGDFLIQDNGTAFASFLDSGAITFAPTSGQSFSLTLGGAGDFIVNSDDLYVDTSVGFVGIGTSVPLTGLHVNGSGQSSSSPTFPTGNQAATLLLSANSNGAGNGGMLTFGVPGSVQNSISAFAAIKGSVTDSTSNGIGDLLFLTRDAVGDSAFTERMRILANGNVGIGKTAPGAKLDVISSLAASTGINIYGTLFETNFTGTAAGVSNNSGFYNIVGVSSLDGMGNQTVNGQYNSMTLNSNSTADTLNASYNLLNITSSRLTTNGNTATAAAALIGYYINTGGTVTSGFAGQFVAQNNSGSTGNNYAVYASATGGTNNWGIYSGDGNNYFNGNVGIGTTAVTTYKLQVAGDIFANGGSMRVSGNNPYYFESWGGGWYMTDSTWVRSYSDKNVYVGAGMIAGNGGLSIGYSGGSPATNGAKILGDTALGADLTIAGNVTSNLISAGNRAMCNTANGGVSGYRDCLNAPVQDYAEMYPVVHGAEFGDLLAESTEVVEHYATDGDANILYDAPKRKVVKLVKTTQPYQNNVIGIVSNNYADFTSTGHDVIDPSDNPMPIALNGRVPLKVTTENGPIKPGDFITSSTHAGAGMKATKAGYVVGKALEAYDNPDPEAVGQVMVFVNNIFYDPDVYITDSGDFHFTKTEGTYQVIDQQDKLIERIGVYKEAVIGKLTAGLIRTQDLEVNGLVTVNGLSLQEYILRTVSGEPILISTQSAGLLVDSQETASMAAGLEFMDDQYKQHDARIALLEGLVASSSAQRNVLGVTTDGKIAGSSGSLPPSITPTPTVAPSEVLAANLTELLEQTDAVDARDFDIKTLAVNGLSVDTATVSANLRVQGNGIVEGIFTVIDTLTANNLVVNSLAQFMGQVIFKDAVIFETAPIFSADTAGYAVIPQGTEKAEVVFDKEYTEEPVITATLVTSLLTDDDYQKLVKAEYCTEDKGKAACQEKIDLELLNNRPEYIVTNRTKKGFTILMPKDASITYTFSWNAFSVKKVSSSDSSLDKKAEKLVQDLLGG